MTTSIHTIYDHWNLVCLFYRLAARASTEYYWNVHQWFFGWILYDLIHNIAVIEIENLWYILLSCFFYLYAKLTYRLFICNRRIPFEEWLTMLVSHFNLLRHERKRRERECAFQVRQKKGGGRKQIRRESVYLTHLSRWVNFKWGWTRVCHGSLTPSLTKSGVATEHK